MHHNVEFVVMSKGLNVICRLKISQCHFMYIINENIKMVISHQRLMEHFSSFFRFFFITFKAHLNILKYI